MQVITWNMQGGAASGESKWTFSVPNLLLGKDPTNSLSGPRTPADVLLLQECGDTSTSVSECLSAPQDGDWIGGKAPDLGSCEVSTGVWEMTSGRGVFPARRPSAYVLFVKWGSRCNMAILSATKPKGIGFVGNPKDANARPSIAMAFSQSLIATAHGFSGNGNDVKGFVQATSQLATQCGASGWFLSGDFNLAPAKLEGQLTGIGSTSYVWPPGGATHKGASQNALDYAVSSEKAPDKPVPPATEIIKSISTSDHFPVSFTVALS